MGNWEEWGTWGRQPVPEGERARGGRAWHAADRPLKRNKDPKVLVVTAMSWGG